MAESTQQTSHIDPLKALELLKSASWTKYCCDALREVGYDKSAHRIEVLAKNKEAFQFYVILLKLELLSTDEFKIKITALARAEV
jgi:hypothetical protein